MKSQYNWILDANMTKTRGDRLTFVYPTRPGAVRLRNRLQREALDSDPRRFVVERSREAPGFVVAIYAPTRSERGLPRWARVGEAERPTASPTPLLCVESFTDTEGRVWRKFAVDFVVYREGDVVSRRRWEYKCGSRRVSGKAWTVQRGARPPS